MNPHRRSRLGRTILRVSLAGVVSLNLLVAVEAQSLPPEAGAPAADDESPLTKNADSVLDGLIEQFNSAMASLDETNRVLDEAREQKDYGQALAAVDLLIDKVDGLATKVKPGNATEVRVTDLLQQIDGLLNYLRNEAGLDEETLKAQEELLLRQKARLEKGLADLAEFYPQLQGAVEDLKQKRRGVAADILISAYVRAADSLEKTNETIRQILDKLKEYLKNYKSPETG